MAICAYGIFFYLVEEYPHNKDM